MQRKLNQNIHLLLKYWFYCFLKLIYQIVLAPLIMVLFEVTNKILLKNENRGTETGSKTFQFLKKNAHALVN